MAVLDIRLLGELEAEFDGAAIVLPSSRRACALLGWLALRPGQHSRARLAALFWPDVLDASARASLRSALWALRTSLGPVAGSYLHAGRDCVELSGDGLRVDAREFGRLVTAGCPAAAVELHRGDLLSQFDADWVLDAREEHSGRLCAAYAALARAAETDGDDAAARDWAARRAAARPLDEQAARELIRLLAAGGDPAGAITAYNGLAARLTAELGIAPAAETARLVEGLRATPAQQDGPAGSGTAGSGTAGSGTAGSAPAARRLSVARRRCARCAGKTGTRPAAAPAAPWRSAVMAGWARHGWCARYSAPPRPTAR